MQKAMMKVQGVGHGISLALAALLVVVLLASACGGEGDTHESPSPVPAETQPKRGGSLRVAMVRDHSTFDPPVVVAVPDIVFTRQVYDNLILRDPNDLSLIPMLAESWELNDNLTQFTFHLRPNVKFRHGKQFQSEDDCSQDETFIPGGECQDNKDGSSRCGIIGFPG